jgi:hypothetical protein
MKAAAKVVRDQNILAEASAHNDGAKKAAMRAECIFALVTDMAKLNGEARRLKKKVRERALQEEREAAAAGSSPFSLASPDAILSKVRGSVSAIDSLSAGLPALASKAHVKEQGRREASLLCVKRSSSLDGRMIAAGTISPISSPRDGPIEPYMVAAPPILPRTRSLDNPRRTLHRTHRDNMRSTTKLVPLSDWRARQKDTRGPAFLRRMSASSEGSPQYDAEFEEEEATSPIPQRRLQTASIERGRRRVRGASSEQDHRHTVPGDVNQNAGDSLQELFHELQAEGSIAISGASGCSVRPPSYDTKG